MSYETTKRRPMSIPVPGLRRQVGLGDVVAGMTKAVGIQPCAPCKRRQAYLNRLLQLRGLR